MQALETLAGNGDEAFLRVFYSNPRENYPKPDDASLRSSL